MHLASTSLTNWHGCCSLTNCGRLDTSRQSIVYILNLSIDLVSSSSLPPTVARQRQRSMDWPIAEKDTDEKQANTDGVEVLKLCFKVSSPKSAADQHIWWCIRCSPYGLGFKIQISLNWHVHTYVRTLRYVTVLVVCSHRTWYHLR